jgi:UDP-glucose 4-epimerase
MRVAITGAAGFIGSHVADRLSQVADLVCIDDLSTGYSHNLEGVACEFVEGSILDEHLLRASFQAIDAVVHLAAVPSVPRSIADPAGSHDANATGTMRVLEAARATGRDPIVIVASSSSVYGGNTELPKSETMLPMPLSPYAASKLATEQYALAWQRSFGLPTLALRFFNVFGPRQTPGHAYAAVIPSFVSAALRGEPLVVHGDGRQSRDFTYVGTVTDVIVEAVERRVTHDSPVNLAYGTRTTLLEVIALIEQLTGTQLEVEHVDARIGDVRHSLASAELLTSVFPGVEPVRLVEGLAHTIDWMRNRGR